MKKWWLLIVCSTLLSACGFYLKGTAGFDQGMPYQTWNISQGAMKNALESALFLQPKVTIDQKNPDVMIKVINYNERKYDSAVNLAGNTSEYSLNLTVVTQAYRHGKPLGSEMKVQVQRYMNYSDSDVLGKEEEERTIWREMRADAAEQLVRRFSHLPVVE